MDYLAVVDPLSLIGKTFAIIPVFSQDKDLSYPEKHPVTPNTDGTRFAS